MYTSEMRSRPVLNLSQERIAALLAPYLDDQPVPVGLFANLEVYLDVLLRWNARTNLTAIRDPEAIVQRHFGESLFAGRELAKYLPPGTPAVLDFGSGAGFPGIPIQLLLPDVRVTLAESQNKKSTFLREVVRTLNLPMEVWADRAETLPKERLFDAVTLRAVDTMAAAIASARRRLTPAGHLVILGIEAVPNAIFLPLPSPSHGFLSIVVEARKAG